MAILVDGRFKLEKLLGRGSFGALYSSRNIKTNELVAVKLESINTPTPQLEYEAKIYRNLKNGGKFWFTVTDLWVVGFAQVYWEGVQDDFFCLVMT